MWMSNTIHPILFTDGLQIALHKLGGVPHRGSASCFDEAAAVTPGLAFLAQLERLIAQRDQERPEGSYTTRLLHEGTRRIAQKVGEEGVETALAAVAGDGEELCNETADLLYHLLVLLRSRKLPLEQVIATLRDRHL